MRLRPFLSAALILWMCAPALAQEWKEFAFQPDRFTCNFPGDPKITETTFMSQFGHRLPARVYSVELSPNHKYSVTVVDYSNITQLGLEKQKACPAGSEACRGGSGAPGNSTGPGYSKADKAGAIICDVALLAARREGDASAVDEHQPRRGTPDSPAQCGQVVDGGVGLHARRQAVTSQKAQVPTATRSLACFISRSGSWTRRATAFGTPISITTDSLNRPFRVAAEERQPGAADRAAVVVRAPVGRRAAAATTGDVLKAVPSASAFERTSPIVECAVGATEHRGLLQPAFALGDSMLAEDYEEVAFAHLCAADVACNASSSIGDLRCLRGRIQSFERMLNGGAFGESSWPQGSLEYDGSFE